MKEIVEKYKAAQKIADDMKDIITKIVEEMDCNKLCFDERILYSDSAYDDFKKKLDEEKRIRAERRRKYEEGLLAREEEREREQLRLLLEKYGDKK